MESIITQATIHLQAQDFSDDSVKKAVNFLLSKTKVVDMTHAERWSFDISKINKLILELQKSLKNKTITREGFNFLLDHR